MNRQLNRLALVAVALLVALVVATTYWQTWASAGLQDRQDNAIQRVVQFTVARGLIEGADAKTIFASNRKKKLSGETLYFRRYLQHKLAAQTIGYSTLTRSQAGLERSMNDYLTGANTNLSDAFKQVLAKIGNATVHGNNLVLTIRPKVQRLAREPARDALRRRRRDEPAHRRRVRDGVDADLRPESDRAAERVREAC